MDNREQHARKYGVSTRTISRWLVDNAPLDNDDAMIRWFSGRPNLPPSVRQWLTKVTAEKAILDSPVLQDNKTLEERREELDKLLDEALRTHNVAEAKILTELLVKIDESIRRSEAHAKKIGLDNGETITREKCEQILEYVFYAGNACIDSHLQQICDKLADMESAQDIYHFLKPVLTGGYLFSGIDKMAKVKTAIAIPPFIVDVAKLSSKEYLDNPELIWDS